MAILNKELLKAHISEEFRGKPEIRINCLELTDDYGKFILEPLERGFGITVGNSLRRVILSSLPGVAIIWIKIEGVLHEFSTIPGVLEDTTDIILNLKKVRMRLPSGEPGTLKVEAYGEREVKAGDIECSPDVEILNKELHIATLVDKNAKLAMEMGISKGKGYLSSERQKVSAEQTVVGLIPVDSIFTPVNKVNYYTENIRVGQSTDYERLIIEVWTDRSIKPDEAISLSAKIVTEHLYPLVNLKEITMEREKEDVEEEKSILDISIDELQLSVRSYNCLKRAGISTIGDLIQYSEPDIMNVKNFGQKSLEEIKEKLTKYDLGLKKE